MSSNNASDIFRRYRGKLLSFIRGRSSVSEPEDIVQDVFLRFLQTDSLHPVNNISAWLFTAAKNRIIDNRRKHREERLPETPNDDFLCDVTAFLTDEDSSPGKDLLRNLVWEELAAALDELPSEQRYAFEQTEFKDRSFKELSKKTGIPVATLISRKHYAVKHLRSRLKDIYEKLISN